MDIERTSFVIDSDIQKHQSLISHCVKWNLVSFSNILDCSTYLKNYRRISHIHYYILAEFLRKKNRRRNFRETFRPVFWSKLPISYERQASTSVFLCCVWPTNPDQFANVTSICVLLITYVTCYQEILSNTAIEAGSSG